MKNETILCFAPDCWDAIWRNRHQIMSRISKDNTVYFIEPQRKINILFFKKYIHEFKYFFLIHKRNISDNLIIVSTPPQFPLIGNVFMITKSITPFIVKINNLIIKNYYKKLVKKLSIKTHILWLYNPFHQLLIDVCNQKLVCYYVYDELAEYPKNNKIKFILNKYDTILSKKSDIIFASSLSQVDKRKTLNKNIYLIENAVDFDRFYTVFKTITEMPKDLKNIKKPIIGYAGYLGFQINVELLLLIANNFPDCSLVLVGPNDLEKDNIYKNLIKCDNVYFLGSKYVDEIPKYVKMFDVAIMPYALNTHVLTSFPLKTYEYLSMGKLVVSVKLNSLIPLNDLVFLAEDNEIFILKIREIISHSSEILKEKIEKGIAVSKNNTWDIRVQQIYEVIQNKLK